MKLYNIFTGGKTHLAVENENGIVDVTAAGFPYSMDEVIAGELEALKAFDTAALPSVSAFVPANIINCPDKLLCVGLNYKAHADGVHMKLPEYPVLFSKFSNALAPSESNILLPEWEVSYDYEAELVIVIGKTAWDVSEEDAPDCIFGYTCGNDISLRDAQMRSGQWLIGKTMPGFGPCGPCIVTADEYDPMKGMGIRSYVNGELRQNGSTSQMIFNCAKIVSYASRYVRLEPGDLIFTGTPTGVALEGKEKVWLKKGDKVDIVLEGIGTLTNKMV